MPILISFNGKGGKTNAARITYLCEDYIYLEFWPTHAHGEDYGFQVKTKFSAYHNHFSDYSKKCQCSHVPGV